MPRASRCPRTRATAKLPSLSAVHTLEEAVYGAARAALGDAPLATPALIRAIVDRSARYTSDRGRLAAPADKVGDLAARAAFFTIADAMKIAIPLAELRAATPCPRARPAARHRSRRRAAAR